MARTRSKRLMVLSFLAGIIGLATLAGPLGAFKGEPPVKVTTTTAKPTTTTTAIPAAALGEVGAELDALVEAGHHSDYHAIYSVTDPALPEGLVQTVELWRQGDRFRFDTIERASNGTRRIIAIANGASLRSCTVEQGTQTCKVATNPPADLPAAFIRTIVTKTPKPELTTKRDDIAGFQATCFEADDVGELCLTTDGVMLRLVLQGANVQATRIEDEVPASTFDVAG